MAKILIAEDNPDYQELLMNFLESVGHCVTAAGDGAKALELFHKHSFDLVLLDIMLPEIDGYNVCRILRRETDVPIMMLTALDSESHQIKGFELDIDDYVSKTTSMQILLHKVAAVLKRTAKNVTDKLICQDIVLDEKAHVVTVSGMEIEFTLREFEILQALLLRSGEVVSRKYFFETLWDYQYYGDERILDTHIKNIRKKLGGADCIETVRGVGYRIKREA